MIKREENVSFNSWKLSLIFIIIISIGLIFYKYSWSLICLGGGIISCLLLMLDVRSINNPNLEAPIRNTIFRYILRYISYLLYMLIMFWIFTSYEVIPAAIGLSIPRICLILYTLVKGGERI